MPVGRAGLSSRDQPPHLWHGIDQTDPAAGGTSPQASRGSAGRLGSNSWVDSVPFRLALGASGRDMSRGLAVGDKWDHCLADSLQGPADCRHWSSVLAIVLSRRLGALRSPLHDSSVLRIKEEIIASISTVQNTYIRCYIQCNISNDCKNIKYYTLLQVGYITVRDTYIRCYIQHYRT